jgi:uncharacterized protein YaaN involved in tellurite resistance
MKFEDAGRTLDQELTKLRKYVTNDLKPATRRDMAKLLRKTSERLAELADKLETVRRRTRA